MSDLNPVYYYGKLRRRREFIKVAGLSQEYYYDWEIWFNKCSSANSLLPFLSNNKERPAWLFIVIEDNKIKIGLTILSSDMSGRKYPFLLYFEDNLSRLSSQTTLVNKISAIANKYDGFVSMVSIGDFTNDEKNYFETLDHSSQIVESLHELISYIALDILELEKTSNINSHWINLNNFSSISHQGAFTCTLYNKIYG